MTKELGGVACEKTIGQVGAVPQIHPFLLATIEPHSTCTARITKALPVLIHLTCTLPRRHGYLSVPGLRNFDLTKAFVDTIMEAKIDHDHTTPIHDLDLDGLRTARRTWTIRRHETRQVRSIPRNTAPRKAGLGVFLGL